MVIVRIQELRRVVQASGKVFQSVFSDNADLKRPGSAPPQMDELRGSPMVANPRTFDPFVQPHQQQAPAEDDSELLADEKLREYLSDPEYIKVRSVAPGGNRPSCGRPVQRSHPPPTPLAQYYYANRNINPRLPPPIAARDQLRSLWPGTDNKGTMGQNSGFGSQVWLWVSHSDESIQ